MNTVCALYPPTPLPPLLSPLTTRPLWLGDDFLADYKTKHPKTLLGPAPPRRHRNSRILPPLWRPRLRLHPTPSVLTAVTNDSSSSPAKAATSVPPATSAASGSTSNWIATAVCHEVPHRQFVFTIPKVLRGIFRKRRQPLTHLFHTVTENLRDAFRIRLNLPDGKLCTIAAVHTFGDYLIHIPFARRSRR